MRRVLFALVILFAPLSVSAQTVTLNPTKVEYTASADHAALLGTVPVVSRYQFDAVAMNPLGAIAISRDLGKPTPDTVTGCAAPVPCISVVVAELATLTPNRTYTATVSAIGPGGTAPSGASNPFAKPGAPAPVSPPVVK